MSLIAVRAACRSLIFFGLATFVLPQQVADAGDVISIEEHWELRVGGPDISRSVPQIAWSCLHTSR